MLSLTRPNTGSISPGIFPDMSTIGTCKAGDGYPVGNFNQLMMTVDSHHMMGDMIVSKFTFIWSTINTTLMLVTE